MKKNELMVISGKSETAARILKMVAERRRNTVYTAFSGLRADLKARDGKAVDPADFDRTFVDLEAIGAGKINKSPSRGKLKGFTWSIPIRDVAAALNAPDQIAPVESGKEAPLPGLKTATVIILRRNKEPQTVQVSESQLKNLG